MSESTAEVVPYDEDEYRDMVEPTTPALRRLEAEVLAMDKAMRIARGLSRTPMVPPHFQQAGPRGEDAAYDLAAAIIYGAELGLSAPQSAQNIFVVKGKPAVYARTMAAQVMAAADRRPDPTAWGIEEVEATDKAVVWRAWRDGRNASAEWSIERATQAGYTSNAKYATNPIEMLRAKCIAEVCRIMFPDVLLGMAFTVEELQLENVTVSRVVKQGSRGTAKLREIAESREAPATPEPVVVDAEVQDEQPAAEATASNAQLAEIRKLYKVLGVQGQGILDEVNQWFNRDTAMTRLSDLTQGEAQEVIAELSKVPEDDGNANDPQE